MLFRAMADSHATYPLGAHTDRTEPPISVSHLVRTLGAYLPIITLTMLAVAVGYVIVAATVYVLTPSQRLTSLPFRLEFEGADRGEYPNGTKFSSAELVSTPILLRVYEANNLKRFMRFTDFTRSIIVLESNRAQEELARDYQARLSDPKLTAVDRDRIQREYQLKLDSLSKDQYSINYIGTTESATVPETLVRKVLHDVLREWAEYVSKEQHVLEYRVAVLAPDIVAAPTAGVTNPIIATQILRSNILRVGQNINSIRGIPSSELARTADGLSLDDISFRLEEIVRFRLEPLVHRIAAAGLDNRGETMRFLESQLAYDERQLDTRRGYAESLQQTLAIYMNGTEVTPKEEATPNKPAAGGPGPETVVPQLSDSFIDRLIQFTATAKDTEYRQKVADDYRKAAVGIVPAEEAVAYDRSVVTAVRSASGGDNMSRELVEQQIGGTRAEVRALVVKVHEIYKTLSRNLNPSKELVTITGTQTTRVERALSIKRLALYGVLTCLIALPIIVLLCLIHNRVREEEAGDDVIVTSPGAIESTT